MVNISSASETLVHRVRELHVAAVKPDVAKRVSMVRDIIETYWHDTGTMPTPYALTRLADYLLVDDLADIGKRHRGHEYPFHSGLQTTRRKRSEVVYDPNVGRF